MHYWPLQKNNRLDASINHPYWVWKPVSFLVSLYWPSCKRLSDSVFTWNVRLGKTSLPLRITLKEPFDGTSSDWCGVFTWNVSFISYQPQNWTLPVTVRWTSNVWVNYIHPDHKLPKAWWNQQYQYSGVTLLYQMSICDSPPGFSLM